MKKPDMFFGRRKNREIVSVGWCLDLFVQNTPLLVLYNIFIRLYFLAILLASLWNRKAKNWIEGRRGWRTKLAARLSEGDAYIWMHCSSAGEFEQGKPLAEAFRKQYPQFKLLITFFSPSGYAVAENDTVADVVAYLPLDTKKNAERFLRLVKPQLALFVKYEFWYHHLAQAASHGIPLLLVSAVFREEQIFFKSYGLFFRKMLFFFRHIFVQDRSSLHLLQAHGFHRAGVSGDTRFDRVGHIQNAASPVPFVENFVRGKKTVIAGSTWKEDEKLLAHFLKESSNVKLIIAPHEVNAQRVRELQTLFPAAALYSDLQRQNLLQPVPAGRGPNRLSAEAFAEAEEKMTALRNKTVLLVDSIGLLSRLYQHATIAYVGGGFTKDGVHNVLEAAVWGKPVFFGANYNKYREAKELIEAAGGFSIVTGNEFTTLAHDLLQDENRLTAAGKNAGAYVESHTGATARIIGFIQENRLLTRP